MVNRTEKDKEEEITFFHPDLLEIPEKGGLLTKDAVRDVGAKRNND